ncbi:MAG: helix-turn-helix transcriptional regulator, partial [Oscillospiraceae bacterium]|nr:helix-turn-helix transcriptional regulator [Oscillospiraceae bacterium]
MLASEAFGKKLRELRIAQGLTQQQLAEQVYVSRYTVSNWEGGKRLPDVSTISRL